MPQTLTLQLTFKRNQLLSANDRHHWAKRAELTRNLRYAAALKKYQEAKHVRMEQATCHVTVARPDNRRADVSNWSSTVKALVDGAVNGPRKQPWEWHLLPDDDDRHLRGPYLDPAPPTGNGTYRFTLTFTEDEP